MTIQPEPESGPAGHGAERAAEMDTDKSEKRTRAELEDADDAAGFDLEADVGYPEDLPGDESFDLQSDIGFGNGPR